LKGEENMTTADQTLERMPSGQGASAERSLPGHILLVEDDSDLAGLEARYLAAHGYLVTPVETGELALTSLREITPDLVLLDLDLPGTVNGWDVLKALRAYAGTSATPVLLTSAEAAAQKHLRTHGEDRSTLDHLLKPYSVQILLKRIKRMLSMTP
jgi:DNA-binding response OmpR family regulator